MDSLCTFLPFISAILTPFLVKFDRKWSLLLRYFLNIWHLTAYATCTVWLSCHLWLFCHPVRPKANHQYGIRGWWHYPGNLEEWHHVLLFNLNVCFWESELFCLFTFFLKFKSCFPLDILHDSMIMLYSISCSKLLDKPECPQMIQNWKTGAAREASKSCLWTIAPLKVISFCAGKHCHKLSASLWFWAGKKQFFRKSLRSPWCIQMRIGRTLSCIVQTALW